MLGAGALGWPRGMGWGGRWERGSGWGTHVHPWRIQVNVWPKPIQRCKVKKIKIKQKPKIHTFCDFSFLQITFMLQICFSGINWPDKTYKNSHYLYVQ